MRTHLSVSAALVIIFGGITASALAQYPSTSRDIAATCANCHGTNGRSVGTVPGLAGVDRGYMMQQLQDFKAGKRPATIMHQIAKGLSDEQIAQLAAYFAAQKK